MESVLVIDDEQSILNMFRLFLGLFDYRVLTASSGAEGIRLFEKEKPPIVFLDIKMPGIDGLEVLRQIKDMDPDTQVVVITGHGDEQLEAHARQLAGDDFIHKPFRETSLKAALDRLSKRRKS